jgi:hypothetical protein
MQISPGKSRSGASFRDLIENESNHLALTNLTHILLAVTGFLFYGVCEVAQSAKLAILKSQASRFYSETVSSLVRSNGGMEDVSISHRPDDVNIPTIIEDMVVLVSRDRFLLATGSHPRASHDYEGSAVIKVRDKMTSIVSSLFDWPEFIDTIRNKHINRWRFTNILEFNSHCHEIRTGAGESVCDLASGCEDKKRIRSGTKPSARLCRDIWSLFFSKLRLTVFEGGLSSPSSIFGALGISVSDGQLTPVKDYRSLCLLYPELHFVELATNYAQLPISGDGVSTNNSGSKDLERDLSYWRLIGSAVAGFSLMLRKWWHVRRNRRALCGIGAFLGGSAIWCYSINSWLNWWLGS